jgi:hypothetical protein
MFWKFAADWDTSEHQRFHHQLQRSVHCFATCRLLLTLHLLAWYEWFPAVADYFPSSSIAFDAGDSVTLSVTATSNTTGTATIKNNSKNQQVTHTLSTTHALCGMHAEWIVEDFIENGTPVPLVDWGTVTFTNAYATAPNGTTYGADKAAMGNIWRDEHYITHSSSTSTNSVAITYVG